MKYLFGLFVVACLSSCTTTEHCAKTCVKKEVKTQAINSQVMVFGPWGIVYFNDGF